METGWLDLLERLHACALRLDPGSLRATFASDAAEALTGAPRARWLVDPPLLPSLIHPEDRAGALASLRAVAEGAGDRVIEHRLVAADGRTSFCRTAVKLHPGGELWAVIVDASGERRAEELLVKRERLAALGELAGVIAHEVRNPLGAIFNSLGALRKMVTVEGEAALLFEILEEESARLNRITVDLLDWVRPLQPMLQPLPLPPQIDAALKAAERAAQLAQSKVSVELSIDPALPLVLLDEPLLHLALVNVLCNGMQAMPRGGRLAVDVRSAARSGQPWVEIAVTDSGPGISPEVKGRIFEPFFTTRASGTGLGLALVKRVVESHGGEIDVESRLGHGATFTLRLRPSPEGA
jgi:signal transduction histidine kinase